MSGDDPNITTWTFKTASQDPEIQLIEILVDVLDWQVQADHDERIQHALAYLNARYGYEAPDAAP